MANITNIIGENIKFLREKAGFSQMNIARFLDVDQSLISKIEKGESGLTTDMLEKLACLFGVSIRTMESSRIVALNSEYMANLANLLETNYDHFSPMIKNYFGSNPKKRIIKPGEAMIYIYLRFNKTNLNLFEWFDAEFDGAECLHKVPNSKSSLKEEMNKLGFFCISEKNNIYEPYSNDIYAYEFKQKNDKWLLYEYKKSNNNYFLMNTLKFESIHALQGYMVSRSWDVNHHTFNLSDYGIF